MYSNWTNIINFNNWDYFVFKQQNDTYRRHQCNLNSQVSFTSCILYIAHCIGKQRWNLENLRKTIIHDTLLCLTYSRQCNITIWGRLLIGKGAIIWCYPTSRPISVSKHEIRLYIQQFIQTWPNQYHSCSVLMFIVYWVVGGSYRNHTALHIQSPLFALKCNFNLFLGVQLTMHGNWFGRRLQVEQVGSHYL